MFQWCSYLIFTASLIYYWTEERQHRIYLFYKINKLLQLVYFKIFHHYSKAAFACFGANMKKAIGRNLLSILNGAISLVAIRGKELWLVRENHATVKLDLSWNEKAIFIIRAALLAEKLGWWLEYCRSWKYALGGQEKLGLDFTGEIVNVTTLNYWTSPTIFVKVFPVKRWSAEPFSLLNAWTDTSFHLFLETLGLIFRMQGLALLSFLVNSHKWSFLNLDIQCFINNDLKIQPNAFVTSFSINFYTHFLEFKNTNCHFTL